MLGPLEAGTATRGKSCIRNLRRVVPSHLDFDDTTTPHEFGAGYHQVCACDLAQCLAEDIQYLTLLRAFYNRGLIVLS